MRRGIIARIVLALVAVACVTTATSLYAKHRITLEQQKALLLELVTVTANLISAVAAFDAEYSENDHPRGATGATLSQVHAAIASTNGAGAAGELTLVADGGPEFLAVLLREGKEQPENKGQLSRVGKDTAYASPFIAGLAGKKGVMLTTALNGDEVLIAYAPVTRMNWVLATELHVNDLLAPFLSAAVITLLIAATTAALGATFAYRTTSRVIDALETEEKKFHDFAESASDWFWSQNQDLQFSSLGTGNRPETALYENAVVGRTREEFAAEDTSTEKWRRHRADVTARRPFRNFVYDMRTISGDILTVSVSGVPVFDESGDFVGYRGTGSDLTPLFERDRLLEAADRRLRAVFDGMTLGVVLIDATGAIRFLNRKAEQMFGYRQQEIVGKNVATLVPDPDHSRHDSYISEYLQKGENKIIGIGREVLARHADGTTFPIHLGISELEMEGRRHFLGALTDLSKVKSLEAQLRHASKLEAIGQLSGGIAHDFNNLLAIILGNLELIQRDLDAEQKAYAQIGKAISAAERGAGLTRKLLDFSRQSPEKTDLAPVDINQSILDLKDLLARSLTASVRLEIDLSTGLPRAKTDKEELEDALINLIVNARDAMPDGGTIIIETGRIRIDESDNQAFSSLAAGSYIQISVTDTGTGMSKTTIEKAFEPFFSTKETGKGTGLGLPMVYSFAKRSGGHVMIYSEVGLGSTVRIYLPVSDPAQSDVGRGDAEPEATDTIVGGSEIILVVDDEEELTEIAAEMLKSVGYQILTCGSALEAMDILDTSNKVDLVFSDLVMPGKLNGADLRKVAKMLRPAIRFLLTSGYSGKILADDKAADLTGSLLTKPYSKTELTRAVRRALDAELPR